MTRGEKLSALRRYILEDRTDAAVDIAVGTVSFTDSSGRVVATLGDMEHVRASVRLEKQNKAEDDGSQAKASPRSQE